METEELIEVASFTYQPEAQTAMILLEQNGIQSEISGSEIVNAHAFLLNAVGGVKLLVLKEDYEKAKTIIDEDFKIKKEEFGKTCYYCESKNVIKVTVTWKTILLGIITLGIYYPGAFKRYKCNDCGKKLSHFVIN
jgi:DNA-directed RNA polymerase subunit RPC12/RpoP